MTVQITRQAGHAHGVESSFTLHDGRHVGVIAHRGGGYEMKIGAKDQHPATSVELTDDEANALACTLGSPKLVGAIATVQQDVTGLEIDQLPVPRHSPFAGAPLSETRIRSRTGASVLAVIRASGAQPMPGSDYLLAAGDMLLTAGTKEALAETAHLLDGTG